MVCCLMPIFWLKFRRIIDWSSGWGNCMFEVWMSYFLLFEMIEVVVCWRKYLAWNNRPSESESVGRRLCDPWASERVVMVVTGPKQSPERERISGETPLRPMASEPWCNDSTWLETIARARVNQWGDASATHEPVNTLCVTEYVVEEAIAGASAGQWGDASSDPWVWCYGSTWLETIARARVNQWGDASATHEPANRCVMVGSNWLRQSLERAPISGETPLATHEPVKARCYWSTWCSFFWTWLIYVDFNIYFWTGQLKNLEGRFFHKVSYFIVILWHPDCVL
jgi:hypothetical protein